MDKSAVGVGERLSRREQALLARLMQAVQTDFKSFMTLLEEHASELSVELADAAHGLFNDALDARDADRAIASATIAALVYLRTGNPQDALSSQFDVFQVQYMVANTADAYEYVRSATVDLFMKTLEIQAYDLSFRAATLAADCAFFAAEVVVNSGSNLQDRWFMTCLQDLIQASPYMENTSSEIWAQKFVSLLAAATSEVTSRVRTVAEQAPFDGLLRVLAAVAEEHVPVAFSYMGDVAKITTDIAILADLSYRYGDPAVATARLELAIKEAEERKDIDAWVRMSFALYQGLRDTRSADANLTELRQNLRGRIEEYRGQFRSRAGRLWAAQELDRICGEFLLDDFEDEATEAEYLFEAFELNKARMLLDEIGGRFVPFPNADLAAHATQQEQQLLQFTPEDEQGANKPLLFNMRLASLLPIGQVGDAEEQARRRAQLAEVEAFYAQHGSGFETGTGITQLARVMGLLEADEALIEYCIPYWFTHPVRAVWAIVVTSDSARAIPIPLSELPGQDFALRLSVDGQQPLDYSALGNLVVSLRTAIEEDAVAGGAEVQAALETLHKLLVSPLIQHDLVPAKFRHWTIIPHGLLHHVPFIALRDPSGRYLIEEIAVTVAPSISAWAALREVARPPVASFLGLAAPDLTYTDLKPLLNSIDELDAIGKSVAVLHPVELYDMEATEQALRAEVAGKSIVHLATHGDFPEQNALDLHQVLLAASDNKDGRLTAEEVRSMDFSAARLVVLSICNGSLYRFGPGDEPYGLIPALLAAGAESVLGTLWPVEDEVAKLFMIEFYKHLLKRGPAEALRRTCCHLIADNAPIRTWCSFVLVGADTPFSAA